MAKDEITIRVLNTTTQKTKNVFPNIANNKGLMRNMGFVISDPNYEAKMDAFKNKRPFSENGIAKEPVKESFVPKVEVPKPEVVAPAPKNEIATPAIENEPTVTTDKPKRTRRTKAQMEADKLTASKSK